jgi:hypothetical protein
MEELLRLAKQALPFIQPRPDYAGRAEGSLSEQIRAAIIREDLEDAIRKIEEE